MVVAPRSPCVAGGSSWPSRGAGASASSQLTCMRTLTRASSLASSGPKARPKRKLAIVSVMSNGSAAPAAASSAAGVWLAPIVHVYAFITSFAASAHSAHASARPSRPTERELARPSAAPASPTRPHAAICQGV